MEPWLQAALLERPFFAEHPGEVWLERTLDDPFERHVVYALVRGGGPDTVMLTGHYDVVSVDNYGPDAPLAFSPDQLNDALRRSLSPERDAPALSDLESGEYLFGRGILDMKSGLAAGLAVLEQHAKEGRAGNVLFVAVPDEEDSSHGMRSAARQLPEIVRRRGLALRCAVNLDAEVDSGSGEQGQAVFLGSVGKVLPTLLLLGRPTHAGAPFDGVSAALLMAEVVRRIELHPDFIDPSPEAGPPPVLLQLSDGKPQYDVTTPEAVWLAFNLLLRERGPRQVTQVLRRAVQAGMDAALGEMQARAQAFGAPFRSAPAPVLGYAELLGLVEARGGEAALKRLEALAAQEAARVLDWPRLCQRLTLAAVREAGLSGPAAILGFGSLPYPAVRLGEDAAAEALLAAVNHARQWVEAECGVSVKLRPFFPGVSDMSFLGGGWAAGDEALLRANTPAWAQRLGSGSASFGVPSFGVPVVNAGPWGRDYHQRGERVNTPYAFGVLPKLVWEIVQARLAAQA